MRYLPLTDADRRRMLERIGVDSMDDLFADVPASASSFIHFQQCVQQV